MRPDLFYKRIAFVIVICFFSSFCFSQVVYSNKESSKFSFTVGLTSANLLKDSVHYQPGILFNGGFMYAVTLSDRFNIAANLLYTGKSFKNDSPIIKYRYYYLDLPLYLQYKIGENIRINLGGQYSNYTNSRMIVIDGSKVNGTDALKAGSIKDVDYGILGGAEVDISENLSLAARYTMSASTFFGKNKINFGVFQFSINYDVYKSYRKLFHKKEDKAS
ncbi:MAG: outer membrane beta-barrel protein [Bacteroidia bacterium]